MENQFRLLPEQASTIAPEVDALFHYLNAVAIFFTALIAGLIIYFAIKYRRGAKVDRTPIEHSFYTTELSWMLVIFVLVMVMFFWGARLFFAMARPPAGAMQVHVVGRQWMWKFQHPEGNSEINELHVPIGRPIALTMVSEDVIHSLYIPAFRVKHDVLPGRYTTLWFEATHPGEYHLFCAEYCGTKHAEMVGRVVAMEPSQYEAWLAGPTAGLPPAQAGRVLFDQLRCGNCHVGGGARGRGPPLEGILGREVRLQNGQTVIRDEEYLRESILLPAAKIVAGYEPIMPSFAGQISEEGLFQIIAYLKTLPMEEVTNEERLEQPPPAPELNQLPPEGAELEGADGERIDVER